jgi:bifunctional ADP-heptose synthase (sugar kinase/adenylyltransferase)
MAEIHGRLDGHNASWLSGYFDPLLAEHVGRIAQAREPGRLLVIKVTNPAKPLMAQRARAELVAALSMVDFVVLGDGDAAMDADIGRRFIEHVLRAHQRESAR